MSNPGQKSWDSWRTQVKIFGTPHFFKNVSTWTSFAWPCCSTPIDVKLLPNLLYIETSHCRPLATSFDNWPTQAEVLNIGLLVSYLNVRLKVVPSKIEPADMFQTSGECVFDCSLLFSTLLTLEMTKLRTWFFFCCCSDSKFCRARWFM